MRIGCIIARLSQIQENRPWFRVFDVATDAVGAYQWSRSRIAYGFECVKMRVFDSPPSPPREPGLFLVRAHAFSGSTPGLTPTTAAATTGHCAVRRHSAVSVADEDLRRFDDHQRVIE
jgi:hypothetical protein